MAKKKNKTKPVARNYYVGIVSFGEYEENVSRNVYVGESREMAIEEVKKFNYPDSDSTWNKGYVEHWRKGKEIKTEYIVE